MHITIITFGQLTELSSAKITLENIADTDTLQQRLVEQYPALLNVKFAIAVDKRVISSNTLINETSAIALLPPFSGG